MIQILPYFIASGRDQKNGSMPQWVKHSLIHQCAKLNFWSTRLKTDIPCMFYIKFHLPRPIFYSPSLKLTLVRGLALVSLNVETLTHWGWVTHICVSKITIIGSDNGLSPGRRQAIIWTNAGIWWMGPLGTNFSEILIEIHTFSFKKMPLKMSSGKWRPFCLGLNVLRQLCQ